MWCACAAHVAERCQAEHMEDIVQAPSNSKIRLTNMADTGARDNRVTLLKVGPPVDFL